MWEVNYLYNIEITPHAVESEADGRRRARNQVREDVFRRTQGAAASSNPFATLHANTVAVEIQQAAAGQFACMSG